MKKIAVISLCMALFACKKEATSDYTITGNITGFDNNTKVYINKISDSNRQIVIDSTQIVDGKFSISLPKVTSKDFNFITFNGAQGNILLIAENEPISITADKSDLRKAEIKGGAENALFSEYLNNITAIKYEEGNISNKGRTASQTGNYEELRRLKAKSDSLTAVKKDMRLNILTKNPNSIISVMALSDLVSYKMIKGEEAKAFFSKMSPELQQSRLGINAEKMLASLIEETSDIGDEVADFSGPTPDGQTLSLKKSLGKYTILDFWASWCRPCRVENPNVVRVYNKYHDKGLEIISISLDKDANKWKQAIANDGLTWKHVSHLKFWQEPIAKRFGVRSIPVTYLLDEKGVIIAKNLRGQALADKLEELLGDKGV
ncbi:TlpA disulfide reductase family protein [Aquimarina agarilytica]|uniref:TlpA disulfide reductase family protein n=1 Tax=Aquimarina agarilytica TaxID=1087449 RepID=UPI0002D2B7DD|nr:TlpA disulfide reductase family protein [Aquimarina agarilytica]